MCKVGWRRDPPQGDTIDSALWTLLPPLVAIGLAIRTRQVHVSLLAGIVIGTWLLAGGHPLAGLAGGVDAIVETASRPSSARLLFFCLLIGPLVAYLETYRGVAGLIELLESRRLVRNARSARMLAWLSGTVIFIETNVTLLVTGAVGRPLFDRHGEPREKLAYIADSTSAPVCILLPFNAWGALVLGLLEAQNVSRPVEVFAAAVPFNFYALLAFVLAGSVAWTGWNLGAMRRARPRPRDTPAAEDTVTSGSAAGSREDPPARAVNMLLPLAAMIAMMPLGLWVTGAGDLAAGSGSTSALWAVLVGNATAWCLLIGQRLAGVGDLVRVGLRGMERLLGVVVILLLSMALGDVCDRLGTGATLAGLLQDFPVAGVLLPATFLIAALIAFSTGTSWGTFAMTVPVAVPAAAGLELPVAPFLAACLSGGIFGDHASPISDTTVVASLAAGTDVIDHVRTQLPYALLAGGVALAGFALLGFAI